MEKSRIRPVYKRPSSAEFKKLWKNAIIALDTNVLLHVYRYDTNSRNNLVDTITKLKDRLFIAEQVYFEFHARRYSVINEQFKPLADIELSLAAHKQKLEQTLEKGHSYLSEKSLSPIAEKIEEAIRLLSAFTEDLTEAKEVDTRYEELNAIISNKVGEPYEPKRYEEIQKEYETRSAQQIPPGYMDKGKPESREAGDLVLWFQIIEHATSKKAPIIFVTDDRKEDWWLKDQGKKLGPRPELIVEFKEKTNHLVHFYTTERFLQYADEYLKFAVEPETLREAKKIEERMEQESVLAEYMTAVNSASAQFAESANAFLLSNHLRSAITDAKKASIAIQPIVDAVNNAKLAIQPIIDSSKLARSIYGTADLKSIIGMQTPTEKFLKQIGVAGLIQKDILQKSPLDNSLAGVADAIVTKNVK